MALDVAAHTRVLLTGASGFVGRHVLRELCRTNTVVTAVTRDAARLREFSGTCNIREFDLRATGAHQDLAGHDVLIHLAWDGLPNYHSRHHFETELPAQYTFLSNLIRSGLKSLFITGTCFEYGNLSGPLSECLLNSPATTYGFAKDTLRRQLQFLNASHPFNLTWARLFYIWGDGQAKTSLLSQLKHAVECGASEFNMSGGEQLRDFMPVAEVARIIVALALRQQDTGIVNICSGKPQSVRSLVEGWIRASDWKITLNLGHYPYPDYEPMAFWGDRSKLDTLLGGKNNNAGDTTALASNRAPE